MRWLSATVVGAVVMAGCSANPSDAGTDVFRIPVTVHTPAEALTFQAEIADDDPERQRGLMHREQMDADHGMLFLFPRESQQSFWMVNTLIPLDMIFIKSDRTILGVVHEAEPRTSEGRSVPGVSQFVLEINGGLAKAHGIEAGQRVTFMAPIPGS